MLKQIHDMVNYIDATSKSTIRKATLAAFNLTLVGRSIIDIKAHHSHWIVAVELIGCIIGCIVLYMLRGKQL